MENLNHLQTDNQSVRNNFRHSQLVVSEVSNPDLLYAFHAYNMIHKLPAAEILAFKCKDAGQLTRGKWLHQGKLSICIYIAVISSLE